MKESPHKIDSQRPNILGFAQAGKIRRMSRLFSRVADRILIVPIDDSLIFGPTAGLEQVESKLQKILLNPPDALLAFPGVFRNDARLLSQVAGIINLTAGTSRSKHTRKSQVASVHQAAQLGLDAVAVHVNISSKYESEMLRILGSVSGDCESYGMPLLAIMYPRSETELGDDNYDELKHNNRNRYAELVAHSARVAVDLGADLIKTKYTGDPESFHIVVDACKPIPIVVAGGPVVPVDSALQMAHEVIQAGGAGVGFGRNVFSSDFPQTIISALKAIVHDSLTVEEARKYLQSHETGQDI
ncbi:MAG: 2-amino-3,7-dideoxy-D-threo-hept-6-ulosonate synthase [Pyrinomonadaceae bacterium]